MTLTIHTSIHGGAVLLDGQPVFCAGGKNGKYRAEAYYELALRGRTRKSSRMASASGISYKTGEEAVALRQLLKGEKE